MQILAFGSLVVIFVLVLVLKSFKIVPASRALVVFRLGRLYSVCGPGFHIILPFIERGKFIDVGRQTIELKSKAVPILDGSPVDTISLISYQIKEPAKAILNVADYQSALRTLTETHLRKFCSESTLTMLMTERPRIQDRVLESISRNVREWGIQIDSFVINFVDVPEEVQNDLRRKAETERLRRLMSENS